jgi:hypothetical protein
MFALTVIDGLRWKLVKLWTTIDQIWWDLCVFDQLQTALLSQLIGSHRVTMQYVS